LSERLERTLSESAETSYGPAAPSNDDLAAALNPLQILAKTVVQLANTDFAPRLM